MRLTANKMKDKFPAAVDKLVNDSYVDDVVTAADSEPEAEKLAADMTEVASSGGFSFKQIVRSGQNSDEMKVLGLIWKPQKDVVAIEIKFNFYLKFKGRREGPDIDILEAADQVPDPLTKRQLWSGVMSIFDPTGILSPVTMRLKLVMMNCNMTDKEEDKENKLKWDDSVHPDVRKQFVEAVQVLAEAASLEYPRGLRPADGGSLSLVCFVDASQVGLCAMVYLRYEVGGGHMSNLAACKTKVAKHSTIPRNELQAAT